MVQRLSSQAGPDLHRMFRRMVRRLGRWPRKVFARPGRGDPARPAGREISSSEADSR